MIKEFFKDIFNGLKTIIIFLSYKWLYYLIMLFLNNIIMDNCKITLKEFKWLDVKEKLLTIYCLSHNACLHITACFSVIYCFNIIVRLWFLTYAKLNININIVINIILYIVIVLIFLTILFYILYKQKIKTFSFDEKRKLGKKIEYQYKRLYWDLI